MSSDTYRGSILFPASGSSVTYTVLLITSIDKETELTFGYGKHSYSTTITQNVDATLTFTVATANTDKYTSWSSGDNITSTGSPGSTVPITKTLDWTLTNTSSDSHGFGLRLIRQPVDKDWYFQTTEAISSNPAGDAVSNNTVIVADLTDIGIGMELIYHKGTTAPSSTTTIIDINKSTKTITFSTNVAFENGETMTLRGGGSSLIKQAIGADIDFSNFYIDKISAVAAKLTKTVRTTATDQNIALVGTYGLSGGGFVTMSGAGIANTGSTNLIQVVTADDHLGSNGSILTQEDQSVKVGTVITFKGSTQSIDIDNTFTIKSYPSANKTIYLNLDNFITPGVSRS
jgi:hypothetical protein